MCTPWSSYKTGSSQHTLYRALPPRLNGRIPLHMLCTSPCHGRTCCSRYRLILGLCRFHRMLCNELCCMLCTPPGQCSARRLDRRACNNLQQDKPRGHTLYMHPSQCTLDTISSLHCTQRTYFQLNSSFQDMFFRHCETERLSKRLLAAKYSLKLV